MLFYEIYLYTYLESFNYNTKLNTKSIRNGQDTNVWHQYMTQARVNKNKYFIAYKMHNWTISVLEKVTQGTIFEFKKLSFIQIGKFIKNIFTR